MNALLYTRVVDSERSRLRNRIDNFTADLVDCSKRGKTIIVWNKLRFYVQYPIFLFFYIFQYLSSVDRAETTIGTSVFSEQRFFQFVFTDNNTCILSIENRRLNSIKNLLSLHSISLVIRQSIIYFEFKISSFFIFI